MDSTSKTISWPAAFGATVGLTAVGLVGGAAMASATTPADTATTAAEAPPRPADRPDPAEVPFLGMTVGLRDDVPTVRTVLPDGPADAAGIESGDPLVSINGVAWDGRGGMRRVLDGVEPGDTIVVVVGAGDSQESLRVTVGSLADRPAREDLPYFGAHPERPQDADSDGIEVGFVHDGSPAALAGIGADDSIVAVNGIDLSDPWDAFSAIGRFAPGDTLNVTVANADGTERVVKVTLGSQQDHLRADHPRAGRGRGPAPEHGRGDGADRGLGRGAGRA